MSSPASNRQSRPSLTVSIGRSCTKPLALDKSKSSSASFKFEANRNTGALYFLANECRKQRVSIVHAAARRGSLEIAQALLAEGAYVNLRDRSGDTPLRRALNCKHPQFAQLLRQRQATL